MNEEIKKLIAADPKLAAIYAEHPEIQINPWKNLYVGDREFIYDINHEGNDPTEDLDTLLDDDYDYEEEERVLQEHLLEMSFGDEMFQSLPEADQYIIRRHLYEGASLAQIGRELGYTRQNAKHHYERIKRTLRKNFSDPR